MSGTFESCAYCPQLCRHRCPVAVATGHEASTPNRIMATVMLAQRGLLAPHDAARAAALCTGCGACRDHCKYGVDVPRLLREARAAFAPAATPPPPPRIEGEGRLVAVECDERSWAPHLAGALGEPVASLRTPNHLGWALLEHPERAAAWLARLQAVLAGRSAVTACGHCLEVLSAAHLSHHRLEDLAPPSWTGPAYQHGERSVPGEAIPDAPPCCGAHGPLGLVHPELARDVARAAAAQLPRVPFATVDSLCRNALRGVGAEALDPIDLLSPSPSEA
jgi:ferredoxin